MFDNNGEKIKNWAKGLFWWDVILFAIIGIFVMFDYSFVVGLGILVCGPSFALTIARFLYGFGQLVANSEIVAEEYKRTNEKHEKVEAKKEERKKEHQRKMVKAKVADPEVDETEFVDITCSACKAELSFTKGQLAGDGEIVCPMCDARIIL